MTTGTEPACRWPPSRDRKDSLPTAREHQVTQLVAGGLTNPQIAARLGVSPRTVVNHLEHIRDKLDLRTRTQIAAWSTRRNTPARRTDTDGGTSRLG